MLLRILILAAVGYGIYRWLNKLSRSPQSAIKSPPHQPASAYDVLGISPGATRAEIRAAYQRAIQEYHPDRVEGMAKELRELAEKRTKEINAAYEQLKRTGA